MDHELKKKKKKKVPESLKYEFLNNTTTGTHLSKIDSPVTPQRKEKKTDSPNEVDFFEDILKIPTKEIRKEKIEQKEEQKEESEEEEEEEEEEMSEADKRKSFFSQMNDEIFGDPKPKRKPKVSKLQENENYRHSQPQESKIEKLKKLDRPIRPMSEPNPIQEKVEEYKFEEDNHGSMYFLLSGQLDDLKKNKINFGWIGKKLDEKTDQYTKKRIDKMLGFLFKQSSDGERAHKRFVVALKDSKKERVSFAIYKSQLEFKQKEPPIQEFQVNEEFVRDLVYFKTVKRSETVDKKETFENCFWVIPYRDEKKKFLLWAESKEIVDQWMTAIHQLLLFDQK
jgi:hypothetical protein